MRGAERRQRWVRALGAVLICLSYAAQGWAGEAGLDDVPLLRRVPDVAARLAQMPAFLRDTDLRVHLRTYYLNERNSDDTISEAWAGGGWLAYRSGWLLDTFQMGATLYNFAQGTNAISPTTRKPEPDQREYDLHVRYHAPKQSPLRGFAIRTSGGLLNTQGSTRPQYQIRLILEYEIPLL
jgi:hypothetical protein